MMLSRKFRNYGQSVLVSDLLTTQPLQKPIIQNNRFLLQIKLN